MQKKVIGEERCFKKDFLELFWRKHLKGNQKT
jgi:hypothetical protein